MFDLNSLTQPHFNWNTALSLAMASDLVYQKSAAVVNIATRNWQLDTCEFLSQGDTQCFVASTDAAILVAFRGTESLNDWLANLDLRKTQRSYGQVHRGFAGAFDVVKGELVDAINRLQPAGKVIHMTGHSLGGALAMIAACELRANFPIAGIYTFGQPRSGDQATANFLSAHFERAFQRFVFDDDVVPRVPPGFQHAGRLFHFDSNGFLQRSAAESGGASTEPPPLTETEFEALKRTAETIEAESNAVTLGEQETQDELADRSLEGIIPSVRDHRMSRYLFGVRNQISRGRLRQVNESEMFEALEANVATFAAHARTIDVSESFPVQIRVRDLSWEPPPGVVVNSKVGPFVSALATKDAIGQMHHDDQIFSLSLSREIDPPSAQECAVSVPFVQADVVHAPGLDERGDDALIGLIDSGIDILHECFLVDDTSFESRIEAVWVQRDRTGPTPKAVDPIRYSQDYGTLYTRQQIQKFINDDLVNGNNTTPSVLRDPGPSHTVDYGHGTHVASIAAGRAVGTFGGGMAPEARIAVVVPHMKASAGSPPSLGYSNAHQDALAFLYSLHQGLELPMAVNVSLGMNAGAHDGTSDTEKVFDAITQNGKAEGFVVVKSAGNERGHDGRSQIQAAPGIVMEFRWQSSPVDRDRDYLEFWYHADDELRFTLIDPNGNRSSEVSHALRSVTAHFAGNDVHMNLTLHVPDNDDNRLVVQVIPVGAPILPGEWILEVVGVTVGPGNGIVDGWVERDNSRPVRFTVGCKDETTLSIPGTADTVVCVAASDTGNPLRLTPNSSFGPTRSNGPKPNINAPGEGIIAARSNSVDHQAVVPMSGTSMAAPHVTGAMALVLSARHKKVQADGTKKQFNAVNLAGMLRRGANHANTLHNRGTGFGSLNALKFFREADLA